MFSALWSSGDKLRVLTMISEMLSHGIDLVEEAFELLVDMRSCCEFRPSVFTYNIVLLGFCKAHRIEEAIDVLESMVGNGLMLFLSILSRDCIGISLYSMFYRNLLTRLDIKLLVIIVSLH
ncbi:unnamed protein product [Microthlaspi erraticum]|uniref:Pentacotripeptide-repeat region of PRORP domain-containing protein n=1 Tax=Microthlaspi erraticum TaxID=1685480 RepID=A0A6D2JME3_9BRAS|nr:unnamed protein product [Microthlaspi erraticum]